MSTFEVESKIRDDIKEVNWEKVSTPNMETEDKIDDYGDYAVVDDFLQFPDEFVEAIKSCPADYLDIVAKQMYGEIGKFPFRAKEPGINQLLVPHYMTPLLFGFYKSLIDCEFIPSDLNTNLEGEGMRKFLSQLPGYCSTVGNLMYPKCIHSVNAHIPTFAQWDYTGLLFLNDNEGSEFNVYDLKYGDKYYSNAEDIMEEDEEVTSDIAKWLNDNALHKEESQEYEKFKETDHFIQTRSVEAKKNRLIIMKGVQFRLVNYSGEGELYTLQLGMNDMPKPKSMDGNEFQNDEVYS